MKNYEMGARIQFKMERDYRGRVIDIPAEQEVGSSTFAEEYLYDGVHIRNEKQQEVWAMILWHVGKDKDIMSEVLRMEDMVPRGTCWDCGRRHGRDHWCMEFSPCFRCGSARHHPSVCRTIMLMCKTCGDRGHSQDFCPKNFSFCAKTRSNPFMEPRSEI